jgi:hypothetical protein
MEEIDPKSEYGSLKIQGPLHCFHVAVDFLSKTDRKPLSSYPDGLLVILV